MNESATGECDVVSTGSQTSTEDGAHFSAALAECKIEMAVVAWQDVGYSLHRTQCCCAYYYPNHLSYYSVRLNLALEMERCRRIPLVTWLAGHFNPLTS